MSISANEEFIVTMKNFIGNSVTGEQILKAVRRVYGGDGNHFQVLVRNVDQHVFYKVGHFGKDPVNMGFVIVTNPPIFQELVNPDDHYNEFGLKFLPRDGRDLPRYLGRTNVNGFLTDVARKLRIELDRMKSMKKAS